MPDVTIHRDFVMTTATGEIITVTQDGIVIETECIRVTITGADYERLKAEIARHVSPAAILGKPLRGIGGEDIYLGIRKRSEGL